MAQPHSIHVGDKDVEFDWDLSLEDELLLSNIADHAQNLRPRSPSTSSETTITYGRHSTTSRVNLKPTSAPLRADISAAFPPSPWTEATAEDNSISDTTSIGPAFHHGIETDGTARHRSASVKSSTVSAASVPEETGDVQYPDLSVPLSAIAQALPREEDEQPAPAVKSPLARFRTYPKKPLSVSDFTAAEWCEVQHEFTLTRLGGRKPRTAAMKSGTRIHENLEREVHRTVRVDITTKEDAFGLKLWNLVQGLRTLRDDGLTRELEVWGLIDGHVVNGLIDGLSVQHPDPQFEEEILSQSGSQQEAARLSQDHKITDFFGKVKPSQELKGPSRKVWVFDVKTRGHWSLPSKAHIRPSMIQLYLYHRFLSDMASDRLDYLHVYRRFGLDPDLPFSDVFLSQIGALHDEVFQDSLSSLHSSQSSSPTPDHHPVEQMEPHERLRYRSLRQLVPLLRREMRQTFPRGAASLGQVVSVEYRYRGLPTRNKEAAAGIIREDEPDCSVGALIGHYSFDVGDELLSKAVQDHMEWWRGERPAEGVPIEEADKCRYCQFADDCQWRAENHLRVLEQNRQRRAAQSRFALGGRTERR